MGGLKTFSRENRGPTEAVMSERGLKGRKSLVDERDWVDKRIPGRSIPVVRGF